MNKCTVKFNNADSLLIYGFFISDLIYFGVNVEAKSVLRISSLNCITTGIQTLSTSASILR